ncbi:MAG: hypothetical protein GY725_08190 [bacterium]|nr:hypothetical protein [bacterium]
MIWHLGEADELPDRRLWIYDSAGATAVEIDDPREVRWLGPRRLLVGREIATDVPGELPATQLLLVTLDGSEPVAIGNPGHIYGAEPSPDATSLALSVDIDDAGESRLEIWSLEEPSPQLIARREQNLDEPRWSPDGEMLLVARMVNPDAGDDGGGLSFAGQSVPFPRLFALPSDLLGDLVPIRDGANPDRPAPGGSMPAWWDERGVFARQNSGLMLCRSPESGCEARVRVRDGARMVDARPLSADRALILLADSAVEHAGLPSEIWIESLVGGIPLRLLGPGPMAYPLDVDWTGETPEKGAGTAEAEF